MRITVQIADPSRLETDWLAVGIFDGKADPNAAPEGSPLADRLARLIEAEELDSSVGSTYPMAGDGLVAAGSVLAFGLGKQGPAVKPADAFDAGVAIGKKLAAKPRKSVTIALPKPVADASLGSALLEGVIVGTESPGLRKTEANRHPFEELGLIAPEAGSVSKGDLEAIIRRARAVGESVNFARDLANTPPSEKAPTQLAARIAEVARATGLAVEIWDRDRIVKERMGALLGVAAGSDEPPAFMRIDYRGAGANDPVTAIIGKGITFDSGGLSLKPSASMEDMKADMTGAAVAASTIIAVAKLGPKANVSAYLAMAENMTGGSALKLGDVLQTRAGKTVEVMNTDAEGRLVLADALDVAAEAKPARMIDLATLTGACVVALGNHYAGLFATDDALADSVLKAANRAGERAWRLPLDEDFDDLLKSPVADFKNVGGKWGGAITASKFLQKFTSGIPWCHLDIAGPSWAESESATRDAGATGCFVRTLVALIEDLAG